MHELAPGAEVWAGEDGPIGGGDDGTCINGGPKNDSACGLYATTLWYYKNKNKTVDIIFGYFGVCCMLAGRLPPTPSLSGPTACCSLSSLR